MAASVKDSEPGLPKKDDEEHNDKVSEDFPVNVPVGETSTNLDNADVQKGEISEKIVGADEITTVQSLALSSPGQSETTGSSNKIIESDSKVAINNSEVKELQNKVTTSSLEHEISDRQNKSDECNNSSLMNPNDKLSATTDKHAPPESTLITQLNQTETFSEEKSASVNSVTSDDSEQQSDVKHRYKSEISVEDNVFEDGTKAQVGMSPGIVTTNETVSLPEPGQPQSVSCQSKEKGGVETHEERPVREMLVRRSRTESTESSSDKPVLETLTFNVSKKVETIKDEETRVYDVCVCLLCERSYPSDNKEDILAHLVLMHKFVIADVNFIGHLPEYMRYWKKRFQEKPFAEFCSKIVTNVGVKDDASKEEFFLLCDALAEDKELRENLQRKKLESVLAQQQKEREEAKFCRQCLFCKQTFCGNRAVLIDHLVRDHSFHLGRPDNLVFTDEMFDLIQLKLDNQLCLFCEKSFKDKASLKEHMRKKQHRKINPKHKEYDRFYIVNYMEVGKNWQSLQSEDNRPVKTNDKCTNEEDDWSGWNAESESGVVCLFCDVSLGAVSELQEHMKDKHRFDLHDVSSKLHLNFYQKVKLINYIRRQVYHKTCYGCQQAFEIKDELLAHLDEFSEHIQKVPDNEIWDQPQYFFPTYEDDSLLCNLDDDEGEDEGATEDVLGMMVIKEDIPVTDTILKDKKLCHDLLKA